jgi:hypothetical protein
MMFDKGTLSNVIKQILSIGSHPRKPPFILNCGKNIMISQCHDLCEWGSLVGQAGAIFIEMYYFV